MRFLLSAVSFLVCAGIVHTLDLQSGEFIEYLLTIKEPSAPVVFEDAVIFTAPSLYKRVGIAFANENFAAIHWFVKLLVPINETAKYDPKSKIPPEMLRDSGILFCAYSPPANLKTIEYRLIIDGLWSADPLNLKKKVDSVTGLELSVISVPGARFSQPYTADSANALSLTYRGETNEQITVAGDFNNWDPFMYQMKEVSPGLYSISIPLPAGTWRYVFFQRGQRILDPSNLDRVYSKNGMAANSIVLK